MLKEQDNKVNTQYKNQNTPNCFLNYCLENSEKGYCTSLIKSTDGIYTVETKDCRPPIGNSNDITLITDSCKKDYDGLSSFSYSDRFGKSSDAPPCNLDYSDETEFCKNNCSIGMSCTPPLCEENNCNNCKENDYNRYNIWSEEKCYNHLKKTMNLPSNYKLCQYLYEDTCVNNCGNYCKWENDECKK